MCGIIGITSNKLVSSPIINSLKKLEYRGYDSAGIMLSGTESLNICKTKGKVEDLKRKAQNAIDINGQLGLGHTRWATHGEPSDLNAHPHKSGNGRLSMVHNGIIENYMDLKSYLKKKSFVFKSDTDSEVICHLINYYFSKSANMQSAIISTANSLEGSYALAAINAQTPHTIYSACKGSPIILGKDVSSNYISSDMTPIVDHTKNYIPMDDNEFAEISSSDIKIFNKNWNYFENMNDQEIEFFIKSDLTWHKSTKTFGSSDNFFNILWNNALDDKLNIFKSSNFRDFKKTKISQQDKDALQVMELNEEVKWEQIHSKFKELVKKYHPDKNQGNKKFEEKLKKITLAYSQLKKTLGKK